MPISLSPISLPWTWNTRFDSRHQESPLQKILAIFDRHILIAFFILVQLVSWKSCCSLWYISVTDSFMICPFSSIPVQPGLKGHSVCSGSDCTGQGHSVKFNILSMRLLFILKWEKLKKYEKSEGKHNLSVVRMNILSNNGMKWMFSKWCYFVSKPDICLVQSITMMLHDFVTNSPHDNITLLQW